MKKNKCFKNIVIINIGDELLVDQLNTNLIDISNKLFELNYSVTKAYTIRDNKFDIKNTFSYEIGKADLLIFTGGLGPTVDDITQDTIAEIVGFDEAIVLKNDIGTASGFIFQKKETTIIFLPGVPYEMRDMFDKEVIPRLGKPKEQINRIYFKTFEISETEIQEGILRFADKFCKNNKNFQYNLKLLPHYSIVTVKLDVIANDKVFNEFQKTILEIFYDKILTFENIKEEEMLISLLNDSKMTVSTAESCTGGLISKKITDVSGSSCCFVGGNVAYSNAMKIDALNVKRESLEKYGAVSDQVAREMAEGMIEKTGTNFAIATTGIAGPSGGTKEKPVGLVYVAIADNKNVDVFKLNCLPKREVVRESVAVFAISKLIKKLKPLCN